MDEQKNVQVVQNAYGAFGRGDVDAVLGYLAENIDWQSFGPEELPTAGRRQGKAEVGRFFKQVAEAWNFERFEPRQFVAQGEMVIALGSYAGTSKSTGRKFASEWTHAYTFRDGKATTFREYTDTASLISAARK